ncbi:hypothetical protein CONPUDRAFT_153919 [Coniophora puteana RWD-64-598 SS2]|uniref:Uncharacterized protein n=1 Tax=Coniophora puteana (strain RWD-64-598) TaxID=741705 RepID=A0A5M3MQM4_CONPW|nr:uncharacterized protein CONPUDRAFT_153919 [Coniophora puteana RWD-64-598 SS2]EIW81367.1 hypothetical protein CONPUDRAFT_153919 [Coniophora puteana RWD-64-598 SS2]
MSNAFVVGMFSLINGVRRSQQAGNSQTFYCFYDTVFRSEITTSSPAQLRVYSPVGGQVARDDTLAFVVATAYFNRNGPILLDAQPNSFSLFQEIRHRTRTVVFRP